MLAGDIVCVASACGCGCQRRCGSSEIDTNCKKEIPSLSFSTDRYYRKSAPPACNTKVHYACVYGKFYYYYTHKYLTFVFWLDWDRDNVLISPEYSTWQIYLPEQAHCPRDMRQNLFIWGTREYEMHWIDIKKTKPPILYHACGIFPSFAGWGIARACSPGIGGGVLARRHASQSVRSFWMWMWMWKWMSLVVGR